MAGVGIDFGTTNSSMVFFDEKSKQTHYLIEHDGDRAIPSPSVVWYHDNQVIVGKDAKSKYYQYVEMDSHKMVKSIKASLGSKTRISVLGNLRYPYEIAADILKDMKKNAIEKYHADLLHADLGKAVVSIPLSFTGEQRRDLKRAAEMAGINVETFIHEPFAAVIGFLIGKSRTRLSSYNNNYILVFDWGGGTLDITVIYVDQQRLIEVGTSQLTGIAGDWFDQSLTNLLSSRFKQKHINELGKDKIEGIIFQRRDRLMDRAEKCKINLSVFDNADVDMSIYRDPDTRISYDLKENITRKDFEKVIETDIQKAVNRVDQALQAASINDDQISLVLMTGGTSQIPMIIQKMRDRFGHKVYSVSNSDTIIAEGAAIVAANNWKPFLSKNIMVKLSDDSYWTAFEKNISLISASQVNNMTFQVVDNRENARVIVADGIDDHSTSSISTKGILEIPSTLHDIEKFKFDCIKVDFEITPEFILHVSGYSDAIRRRKSKEIYDICFGLEVRENEGE